MKTQLHVIFSLFLFLTISVLYYQLAVSNPVGYMWASYEDLLGEWAQFYLFIFALIYSLHRAFRDIEYRYFFIVLAVACLYVVLEEISWGQRIFGWGSSEFFKKNNLQGETNLHNMMTGPYNTWMKITLEYVLALGLSGYGLIYPLMLKWKIGIALWVNRLGIPAPPLYLAPFFVAAAFLELRPFGFNEAEIAEIFVGLGLAVTALHYLYKTQQKSAIDWTASDSVTLTLRMVNMVFLVLLLSAATTFSIYATDAGKKRADNRINNGIAKFTKRYEKHKNWDMVVLLANKRLQKSPGNRSVLRSLAKVYQQKGDNKNAKKYLMKAIKLDLAVLKKEPWRASTNRSLSRSYRMLGDKKNSKKHLDNALKIGSKRIKNKPDSAAANYSLGKTYLLMGEKTKAKPLFAKAYELKPTSMSYRKEYYRSIQ